MGRAAGTLGFGPATKHQCGRQGRRAVWCTVQRGSNTAATAARANNGGEVGRKVLTRQHAVCFTSKVTCACAAAARYSAATATAARAAATASTAGSESGIQSRARGDESGQDRLADRRPAGRAAAAAATRTASTARTSGGEQRRRDRAPTVAHSRRQAWQQCDGPLWWRQEQGVPRALRLDQPRTDESLRAAIPRLTGWRRSARRRGERLVLWANGRRWAESIHRRAERRSWHAAFQQPQRTPAAAAKAGELVAVQQRGRGGCARPARQRPNAACCFSAVGTCSTPEC